MTTSAIRKGPFAPNGLQLVQQCRTRFPHVGHAHLYDAVGMALNGHTHLAGPKVPESEHPPAPFPGGHWFTTRQQKGLDPTTVTPFPLLGATIEVEFTAHRDPLLWVIAPPGMTDEEVHRIAEYAGEVFGEAYVAMNWLMKSNMILNPKELPVAA